MLVDMLYRLGLDSVAALRGRTDLLTHLDYEAARVRNLRDAARSIAARSA